MKRAGLAVRFVVVVALTVPAGALVAWQQPAFRAAGDLIAVDVQVLDRQGAPVPGLEADQFEVSLDGHRRQIASLERIGYDGQLHGTTASTAAPTAAPDTAAIEHPRTFVLAIDTWSFDVGTSRGVVAAATTFIQHLQPADRVALAAYPSGPSLDPTTNHTAVLAALDKVVSTRERPPSVGFPLTPTDVVDGGGRAAARLCPPRDFDCYRQVELAVRMLTQYYEATATQSLGALREILRGLAGIEGRKTLVLLSGGLPLSDRPGQRPDVGNLGVLLGQDAARANTGVYTLFVDWRYLESFSASRQQASSTLLRDSGISSVWLDQFSGTAGGKLFTVSVGNGTFAFDRILKETSSYYLLGVKPEPADRDGKPKHIRVEVKLRGTTVRARTWVVVRKTE